MIIVSIDIGTKNFAMGIFKFHGGLRPIDILSLRLFSTFQGKKRATWEQRIDSLTYFIIEQLTDAHERFPDCPIHTIIELQLGHAHANGRIASSAQSSILTWCATKGIADYEITFLHALGKFPHGIPADFPSKATGGAPHSALKSYSKQVCRQHLEAYGYEDWIRYIFQEHADKSDDLCDVTLQALSYSQAISKEYAEKFIQPPIPFIKPKRASSTTTTAQKPKRAKKQQRPNLPLPDSMYENVEDG